MNRLLTGVALLVMAAWLARTGDKATAGPAKSHWVQVEWRNSPLSSAPDDALAPNLEVRPSGHSSGFDFDTSKPIGLLEHDFADEPPPTGKRLRIDGDAPKFVPAEK
jgi:hypothetical protein